MGSDSANTEIVGVMLLIGISVALFSVVYFSILTADPGAKAPDLSVVVSLDENENLVFHHQGGESVDGDNKLQITIAGLNQPLGEVSEYILNDLNHNSNWDFGETLVYPTDNVTDLEIQANIIDHHSNSLVLSSFLKD